MTFLFQHFLSLMYRFHDKNAALLLVPLLFNPSLNLSESCQERGIFVKEQNANRFVEALH